MEETKPLKAIYRHTIRFYAALSDQAVIEEGLVVFRGHPTSVATEDLGLPLPYYSKMREILITLECVKQIKRGSGKTESVWVLVHAPSEDDFDNVELDANRFPTAFRLYQLATDAAIKHIEQRMGGINIAQALVELQQQVDEQQRQIDELQATLKEKDSGV